MQEVGSWIDCNPNVSHPGVKVKFFKTPKYKYPFCDLCLYEIQKRNGTLQTTPIRSHIKQQCKPEKDTL